MLHVGFSYVDLKDTNMKQNIAISFFIGLAVSAWASQPVATAPPVYKIDDSTAQVQVPVPQPPQAAPVIYNYTQQSWPQSAPSHDWVGYVPTVYQPSANNAFDSAPASEVAYSVPYAPAPYAPGYCAPGLGVSVGFGIGAASVGIGPCGIHAGVGLGCFPIGVGFGSWCY
jgi:hypothetical protein